MKFIKYSHHKQHKKVLFFFCYKMYIAQSQIMLPTKTFITRFQNRYEKHLSCGPRGCHVAHLMHFLQQSNVKRKTSLESC